MSELYDASGSAVDNCTPFWDLAPNQQAWVSNVCLLNSSSADGDIHNCHAQCRKCGQHRLVRNPFAQRWCRRCKALFSADSGLEMPPAEVPVTKEYVERQFFRSLDSFAEAHPSSQKLIDSLALVNDVILEQEAHYLKLGIRIAAVVVVGGLIGGAVAFFKVKLKWAYLP